MNHSQVLSCAMDIGESMLISGGEVYRVEDCIRRICYAYGASSVDVLTITSSIILTIEFQGEPRITETRRIEAFLTDLERVDRLNALSRVMCSKKPDYQTVRQCYNKIMGEKRYSHKTEALTFALIASAFTVFFGGTWQDALISAVIGIILKGTLYWTSAVNFNRVLSNLIASFVMTVLAFIAVRCGLAKSAEMIVIGNIMLLIPGVLLTNSIRDMITGDTITGLLRFAEAIIFALAIAAGYILAAFVFGGAVL